MSPLPLAKAELWPLKEPNGQGNGGAKRLVVDDARPNVVVQFNPASLKIERRSNTVRGGVTARMQHVQYASAEPATLTFDLEFDTAVGGDDGQAQDVREKTKPVRQFVEPPDTKTGEAPPRVRFAREQVEQGVTVLGVRRQVVPHLLVLKLPDAQCTYSESDQMHAVASRI